MGNPNEVRPGNDTRTHGEKIRDTILKVYGPDYYSKLGQKGGVKSKSRPFRDNPGAARKAVNARWERYYKQKQQEAQAKAE